MLDKRAGQNDTLGMPIKNAVEAVTSTDPHPYYRELRERRPLFFDESLNLWVATSHAVVSEALAHPQLRVRPPTEPVPKALMGTAAGEVFAQLVRMTDGDFHAQHKPAVEQRARRWSLADVAQAAQAATADLSAVQDPNQLMALLPVQTMARLLGVPGSQLGDTCRWVLQFVACIAPGASAQAVEEGAQAAAHLMAQGSALGLDSVQAANRIAFMQQAPDATAALMGHTALMLASGPALAATARASLDAMRGFVAEVERYCAPTQNTRRFAAQDLALAGHTIRQGQGVLVVLAAANRDPALNPGPDRFDPARANRRSMGFGASRHACPGAAIAIEIVATASLFIGAAGRFDSLFRELAGYRPLGNIRSPLFTP
jgi:cytochrome P450